MAPSPVLAAARNSNCAVSAGTVVAGESAGVCTPGVSRYMASGEVLPGRTVVSGVSATAKEGVSVKTVQLSVMATAAGEGIVRRIGWDSCGVVMVRILGFGNRYGQI